MKAITLRLRRYKVLTFTLTILSLPIRLPFWILYQIGRLSEKIVENIDKVLFKITDKVVEVFNFDDVATKQFKTKKEKFRRYL